MSHSHGTLPVAVPIPPECLRLLIAQIGEYKILDRRFATSRIPSMMDKSNAEWAANRLESSNPAYSSKQLSASSSSSATERTLAWQEQKMMQSFHDVIEHEVLGDLEDLMDDTQQNDYKEYVPKKLHIGKPHPDVLVESSSLAACALPDITYTLLLPKSTIKSGVLSAPQLEAISYACQTHAQTLLPEGTFRKGFFLGDGAGVGKGRQLAGLIHENWLRGRVKHLWISVSGDLHLDARRDLDDIGAKKIRCYTMKGLPMKGDRIDVDEGIVFSTYQGLISKTRRTGRKKNVSRMDQLVEWCTGGGSAESFEGCIMLDECHKAKNLYPSKGGMQPTRMGLAVFEIQQRLPRARIVYCSATGCSEPADMGYMTRLGLWGVGTSFPGGFQEFRDAFDQGGIGMMELVAMHLKRQGQYLCRTLSYHGCTFTIDEQALSSQAVSVYDRAAMFWIKLYDQLKYNLNSNSNYLDYFDRSRTTDDNSADDLELDSDVKPLSLPKDSKLSKMIIFRYYWNSHQRFFRALCIALKVPRAVEISKEALSSGHCVVIGLQSTGQSGVEHHRDVVSSNDQTPATADMLEFVSTPAVILQRLVKKLFPLPGLSRPSIDLAPIDSIDCKRPRRVTTSKAISYAYPTNDEFAVPIGESEDEERLPVVSKKRPLRALTSSSIQSLQSVPNPSTVRRPPTHGTTKDGINGWSIFLSEGWTLAPTDRLPGSEHIGKVVLKKFKNAHCVDGDVVAFLSAAANEGISLWHIVWSDGDEEDWDDVEVQSGIKLFADSLSSLSPLPAVKRKMKSKLTPQTVSTESSEGSDADVQDSNSSTCSGSESSVDDAESDVVDSAATTALKALQTIRDDFLAQIAEMDLPGNPLDLLVDQLGGPNAVAEMTGRQARFVRDASGSLQFTKRNDGSDVPMNQRNIHERDLFQRGVKRVAIISEAASAGISLHADRRFGDSQRRVHITLELPWAADKAIQQLGRSHRSNQSSAPKYFLLISPQGGERRFAAAVAKRIESLGALTQGDRSATVGAKNMSMTEFNFDTKYGKDAIVKMFQYLNSYSPVAMPHPLHVLAPELPEELVLEILDEVNRQRHHSVVPPVSDGLSFAEAALHWLGRVDCAPTTADLQTVPRFLNRLLGLPSRWQRLLFDFFFSIMESIIRQAKSEMSYDEGIFEVKGSHIAAKPGYPIAAWRSAATGALDEVKYFNLRVDRGCSWSEVMSHYTADEDAARTSQTGQVEAPQSAHGFFVTRNSYQGKHFVLYVPETGPMQRRPHSVTIMRPTTGRNQMERALFFEKYRAAVSTEEAHCLWMEQHESTSNENANSRYRHHHLLTGSVLSIWSVIQAVYDRFNAGNKWKYAIRVARVTLSERSSSSSLDEGEGTLIGVWVPPTRVEEVLKALQPSAMR